MAEHAAGDLPVITGIGCRLPGKVRSPEQFADLLRSGRSVTGPIPPARWDAMAATLAPGAVPEQPWTAGLLEDADFSDFDRAYFGLDTAVAAAMDPMQRLLLETGIEAIADAGLPCAALAGPRTGIYIGSAAIDAAVDRFAPGRSPGLLEVGGTLAGALGSRLARHLDTRGPLVTVDTACSASLVALHGAARDVAAGVVDTAIVAGANPAGNGPATAAFAAGGVLGEVCRPFDADAAGYVRGEGVVVLVLRRSGTARAGGDRIYAVVAGSALGSDGAASADVGAPSSRSQVELLEAAWAAAGLDPAAAQLVQAHGTGTRSGDHQEARALGRVFDRGPGSALLVHSIKGAIGHLEGAAGAAGVAATALMLHQGQVWPAAGHTAPARGVAAAGLRVPTAVESWPECGVRVAGVSGFGFGGSNAHVVLAQAPDPAPVAEVPDPAAAGPVVVGVSAHTPEVLAATAADWAQALRQDTPLGGLAATAARRRDHYAHRAAVWARTPSEAAGALEALAQGQAHLNLIGPRPALQGRVRVVFVFAGHGADHPGMGHRLTRQVPEFAEALEQANTALAGAGATVWRPGSGTRPAGYAQCQQAIWAVQVATARTLASWGLVPDAVIGHSLGEVAAATTAGILTLDEAARVVTARAHILAEVHPRGCLLAAHADEHTTREHLAGGAGVACLNAPHITVVSGTRSALEETGARLAAAGIQHRLLPEGPPAHSPLLDGYHHRMATAVGPLDPQPGRVAMVSTMRPHAEEEGMGPDYWADQLREPVDFRAALGSTAARGPCVVVEVGPAPVLGPAIAQTIAHHGLPAALAAAPDTNTSGSGSGSGDDHTALLTTAAAAYTCGAPPGWPVPTRRHTPLPRPRWHHHTDTPAPALAQELADLPPDQHRGRITAAVRTAVAAVAPAPLGAADDDTALDDLGVGSLGRLRVRGHLLQHHPGLPAHTATAPTTTIATLAQTLEETLHTTPAPVSAPAQEDQEAGTAARPPPPQ